MQRACPQRLGRQLRHYSEFDEGWHAGPHAVGAPDRSIVLGEFCADGVHASCWNNDHFGIETVGEFATDLTIGSPDAASCGCRAARTSLPRSANAWAGNRARSSTFIADSTRWSRLPRGSCDGCSGDRPCREAFAELGGEPAPAAATPPSAPTPVSFDLQLPKAFSWIVALGARIPVDGDLGPQTESAIKAFQKRSAASFRDADAGPMTKAANKGARGMIRALKAWSRRMSAKLFKRLSC